MKIIRYVSSAGSVAHGALADDGSALRIDGDPFGAYTLTDTSADVVRLLAPLEPSALLCIGLNYKEHAAESGSEAPTFPVLFMKSVGSVQHPGGAIELPRSLRSGKVDFEGELAVVIGKTCKNVAREDALGVVFGYTCANDVSARDWQREWGGGQYCRGKTFDTFAPLGPCITTAHEIPDPQKLRIVTSVNGRTMQDSSTSDMIFDVASLIEFLSGSTTLAAGTVILTGTPPGVGMARSPQQWLATGDVVSVAIEGIGELINPVIEEPTKI